MLKLKNIHIMTPENPKSSKKTWIVIGVIVALAIIGIVIWRMIADQA